MSGRNAIPHSSSIPHTCIPGHSSLTPPSLLIQPSASIRHHPSRTHPSGTHPSLTHPSSPSVTLTHIPSHGHPSRIHPSPSIQENVTPAPRSKLDHVTHKMEVSSGRTRWAHGMRFGVGVLMLCRPLCAQADGSAARSRALNDKGSNQVSRGDLGCTRCGPAASSR